MGGTCSSKAENSRQSVNMIAIPELMYFNRIKGKLLRISNKKIEKIAFEAKFFYSPESAIAFLTGKRLIVVGGAVGDCLSNTATIVSLVTNDVESLPNIPIPCKEGQLHEIGEWVYYVGALQSVSNNIVPAPILRFNYKLSLWEEIIEPESENEKIIFSSYMQYGSCVMNKKILIFGGMRICSIGTLKCSKKIFSLSFADGVKIKEEGNLPLKLVSPQASCGEKHGLIVGGFNAKTGEPNKACFYIINKEGVFQIHKIDSLTIPITENYPPVYTKDYAMFITYPHVAIRFRDKTRWMIYQIKNKNSKSANLRVNESERVRFSSGVDLKKNQIATNMRFSNQKALSKSKQQAAPALKKSIEKPEEKKEPEAAKVIEIKKEKIHEPEIALIPEKAKEHEKFEDIGLEEEDERKSREHHKLGMKKSEEKNKASIDFNNFNPNLGKKNFDEKIAIISTTPIKTITREKLLDLNVPIPLPHENKKKSKSSSSSSSSSSNKKNHKVEEEAKSQLLAKEEPIKVPEENSRIRIKPEIIINKPPSSSSSSIKEDKNKDQTIAFMADNNHKKKLEAQGNEKSEEATEISIEGECKQFIKIPSSATEKLKGKGKGRKGKGKEEDSLAIEVLTKKNKKSSSSSSSKEKLDKIKLKKEVSAGVNISNPSDNRKSLPKINPLNAKSANPPTFLEDFDSNSLAQNRKVTVEINQGKVEIIQKRLSSSSSSSSRSSSSSGSSSEKEINDSTNQEDMLKDSRFQSIAMDDQEKSNNVINYLQLSKNSSRSSRRSSKEKDSASSGHEQILSNNPNSTELLTAEEPYGKYVESHERIKHKELHQIENHKIDKPENKTGKVEINIHKKVHKKSKDSSSSSSKGKNKEKVKLEKLVHDDFADIKLPDAKKINANIYETKNEENSVKSKKTVGFAENSVVINEKKVKKSKENHSESSSSDEKESKSSKSSDSNKKKGNKRHHRKNSGSSSYSVESDKKGSDQEKSDSSEDGLKVVESSSSSNSDSSNSDSSDSYNYRPVKNRVKRTKTIASVSSSDVSDTENDVEIAFTHNQGSAFLKQICIVLKMNPFFSVPNPLNITGMSNYLLQLIPKRNYSQDQDLFKILAVIHEVAQKKPLREKEKWNILMCSKLLPENTEISAEEMAHALSRAFKYILMRKA
ncbi:hypothetical protein SteCoe_36094 [Stentor coeruleus]|uniref:Uncharacterized protein n=1 Tax=Stentor coeruleus TaxID=5963 RepID=A0A1R2AQY9_9CILI|nr:hypothetical protein SteCoe_36094 [Stentor coeruleus]